MKLLVINGPNLNMLGIREPDIYGKQNFAALESFIRESCDSLGFDCELFQSNYEGAQSEMCIEKLHRSTRQGGVGKGVTNSASGLGKEEMPLRWALRR